MNPMLFVSAIVLSLLIRAAFAVIISILIANLLPIKPIVGVLIVVSFVGILFVGGLAVSTWGVCGINTGNYSFAPYGRYFVVYRPYGILALVYGFVVGVCVYIGSRLWRSRSKHSVTRVVLTTTSAGLILLSFIMIMLGLFFFDLQIAMLADETSLCQLTKVSRSW